MAFNVYEMYNSRRVNMAFDRQTAELKFFGMYTLDDVTARAGFIAATPTVFFGLLFENLEVEPVGGGFWVATVTYGSAVIPEYPGMGGASPPPAPPPAPTATTAVGPDYSFDITAVEETIYQSKETIHGIIMGGGIAPSFKRAIAVSGDGEVKGCVRISPKIEWSTTKVFGFITPGFVDTLSSYVGTYNDDTFYGAAAGEQLFIGANVSIKDTQRATVTFKFLKGKNETNIYIVGTEEDPPEETLVIPDKNAHEIIWVLYEANTDRNRMVQVPFAAYVERIYDPADFSGLGIGT